MQGDKLEIVNKSKGNLARFCASLSNDTRITILETLARRNSCEASIKEIAGLSKFTVEMNLKYLKKYGLVKGSFKSKNTSYCIDYERLEELKDLFDAFYNKLVENRPKTNSETVSCINKKSM